MKQGVQNFLRRYGLVFAIISLLSLAAVSAFGQAIDGNVVGTVTDASGAAVVGADVTAINVATNVTASTKTGATGDYRFDHLLVGTYRITAQAAGFKTTSELVPIDLNKTATRNITLTPGATSETIEVSGVPPVLDTTTAQLQSTFQTKQLEDLPLASQGSGVINLSLLDAGVATSGGVGAGSGPSVSGQRPRNNNYTVEGVDNNSKSVTGPLLQLPNDAVEQFTVLQNQFSPEFGHSSGGQFNQTIKSGTNSFHGRVYEYFQNRNLNAQDSLVALSQVSQGLTPFNTRYDNNRFGGQFGGPIIKNKLFFFTDWEYNPIGNVTSSTACGPTAAGYAMLQADASVNQTNVTQFQKYVGAALRQAPTDGSDPNCFGTSAIGANAAVPIGDIGFSGANYSNILTGVTSMDWNISDKDQVRGRYAYEKFNGIDYSGQIPAFWTIYPQRYHIFTLSEYHTFTPFLSNEVRLGFNRNSNNYPAGNFSFPGLDAYPNLIVGFGEGNGVQLGPDPNAPQFGYQDFYQVVDNVSWIKGKHNFKFGAEYREYISPQGFTQRVRGDYDYTTFNLYFTDQVPDYLAERSIGNVTYYGNQNMFYGFANDDWRIRKNLSINLGLRYEFTQVPLSERTWQSMNAISSVPGLITFGAPTSQKTNFLPRIGFAWSPGESGKTSIRGGFGMSMDVLYDNLGLLSAPPQVQQTCDTLSGVLSASPTCYWNDPTINGVGFLAGGGLPYSAVVPPITDAATARLSTGGYIPNQQLPYSETWTLGVQHIFANKYTVEVRYVGTRGIHLPVQSRLNRQDKTSATNYLPVFFQAPTQVPQSQIDALGTAINYDEINAVSSFVPAYAAGGFTGSNLVGFMPYGASRYNGLQTQVTRSFTNGLQFQAAWTWSHNMDNSTADVFSTYLTPRRPQNFQCFACDWSDSALDRRQRITLQALYDLPFLKHSDKWVERNVLGNWEFGPIYTFQSPEYTTVQSGVDLNGNGDSAGDRVIINPSGNRNIGTAVTPLCNSGITAANAGPCDPVNNSASRPWVVAYAANNPNAYYVGGDSNNGWGKYMMANARRNTLAMPHINNFDFMVMKRINVSERQSVEFQAQMLNLFNHPQYLPGYISDVAPIGYTGSNVLSMLEPASTTFNRPSAVFTNHPRNMLLVVKYNF
ncbi:MAG TPA: TonB-dependent receptor [Candidatus Sulfotelmatobacter sp.]|nr:TonB-dependent receptor [Candidatus Sulfotelmatobacter sp.]